MTARVSDKDTRENIRKIFNLFDDEKTGFISIKNLRRVAKELGETIDESELQEMIERADTDNDGLVSEEEFYNIITKKTFAAWINDALYHNMFISRPMPQSLYYSFITYLIFYKQFNLWSKDRTIHFAHGGVGPLKVSCRVTALMLFLNVARPFRTIWA